MPTVVVRPDNLDELNRNYAHSRLKLPVFLNSVPKCGTHLLRNIVRMFVPVEQQYHKGFIQHAVLREHVPAFNPATPMLSWGHLFFSDAAAIVLHETRKVLLVRDPYDWVLARARFFLSDTFQGSIEHLKGGRVTAQEVLNMMIFGVHEKTPTLQEIYLHNAVSWLGTGVTLLRYEEIIEGLAQLETPQGEAYFGGLLAGCGIDALPPDWRQRVRVGSDRKQSGTARENLLGLAAEIPDVLPDVQKRLVDFAAPGLRGILGYA